MKVLKKWSESPLVFGGASIAGEGAGYGFGDITESESIDLLEYAYEKGVRIFDTAPIYGFGTSEKRMGKAFSKIRDKVKIVSKSGVTWHPNKRVDMTNDPVVTKKMLEQSLRDLQSDYIDLYMVHWPDTKVDIRKTFEVLAKAKIDGKVKKIGLCNTTKEEIVLASEVDKVDVVQSQLNMFESDITKDLFPFFKKEEIDFMSWGTLDKGILTGRVNSKRKFDRSDCRSWAPWWKSINKEERYKKVDAVGSYLNSIGHSLLEMAVSFNLSFEETDSIICGARNYGQIDGLFNSIKNRLTTEQIQMCIKIFNEN